MSFELTPFLWILASGVAMSCIAFVGSALFLLQQKRIDKVLLPLVAFSAGALLGGAFFHMLPAGLEQTADSLWIFVWVLIGFSLFLALEQFLHWHHCGKAEADCRKPLTILILIGDGLHNFIGGMAVAGTFLLDIRLGIAAWLAAAAHEVPQELGDMGVLIYGGWSKRKAVLFNLLSALFFLAGGIVAYLVSASADVSFLIPFAAGNFLYIGASDLIPEVNKHPGLKANVVHFGVFVIGALLMFVLKICLD